MAPGDSIKSSPFSCRAASTCKRHESEYLPSCSKAPALRSVEEKSWMRCEGLEVALDPQRCQGPLSSRDLECQTVPRWKRRLHHVPLNDMTGHTLSHATGHAEPACKERDWTLSRRRFQRSFPLTTPPKPPFVASPKSNSFAKDLEAVGESKFQRSLSLAVTAMPAQHCA